MDIETPLPHPEPTIDEKRIYTFSTAMISAKHIQCLSIPGFDGKIPGQKNLKGTTFGNFYGARFQALERG
jgi:hypothetical protein